MRDWLEYVKKELQLQKNVGRLRMDERIVVQEEGLVTGKLEGVLIQKLDHYSRCLFAVATVPAEVDSDPLKVEVEMLRLLLLLQAINNKYREAMRCQFEISEQYEDHLLNNRVYGALTCGEKWWFVRYSHEDGNVECSFIGQKQLATKNFFQELFGVVTLTVDCVMDLTGNKN